MSEEIDKSNPAHRIALAIDSLIAHRINLAQCSDINFASEHAKNVGKAVSYLAECIEAALPMIEPECPACKGSGNGFLSEDEPFGPRRIKCPVCKGSRKAIDTKKFDINRDCMSCGGEGVQVALGSDPNDPTIAQCLNCNGSGKKIPHS